MTIRDQRSQRPGAAAAFVAATLLAALLAVGGPAGAADEVPAGVEPAPTVFGPGERMVYSIGYGPVNAGEGTLEVVGLTTYQGHTCYELQSTANSNRFFSSFYKVRDKIISYMDVERLYTRYFHKRLREGDYKKTVEISFDHEDEVAHYADGQKFDIASGIQDVLSAVFFVRNLDLGAGDTYSLLAHSSRKTYDLQVIVHGRETVTVEAGTFDCYVVEPVLEGEGLFKHEGKITLYVTADQHRVPVLIKTKVPVGSIDVELKEFRPGTPLRERPAFTR
ncbi:DUF3108 domain-containing protein [bacterium]|nr:DUF3108 domain-containing protein [bacterium]